MYKKNNEINALFDNIKKISLNDNVSSDLIFNAKPGNVFVRNGGTGVSFTVIQNDSKRNDRDKILTVRKNDGTLEYYNMDAPLSFARIWQITGIADSAELLPKTSKHHIEDRYKKELAALEKSEVKITKDKSQLQRRGNGKSIERKKPLSDEDLMPNFSESIEEALK